MVTQTKVRTVLYFVTHPLSSAALREYSLGGSYRKIMHLPKELSWSVLRYTDPDVPLAQADEDKLLGLEPSAAVEDGRFLALQVALQLGTAAYATMALREVTKTETSSHFQTSLTQASEDQKFKGKADEDGEAGIAVDTAESMSRAMVAAEVGNDASQLKV